MRFVQPTSERNHCGGHSAKQREPPGSFEPVNAVIGIGP
jgi:hypothetical protein